MVTFVNEKRVCGCTIEGFGDEAVRWNDYEIKCVECGAWTASYGEVSVSMNKDGTEQGWLCPSCGEFDPDE